jgi:hypothetical protein
MDVFNSGAFDTDPTTGEYSVSLDPHFDTDSAAFGGVIMIQDAGSSGVITINGNGAVLDAGSQHEFFHVGNYIVVKLHSVTLQNGRGFHAGGIHVQWAQLDVYDSFFFYNSGESDEYGVS